MQSVTWHLSSKLPFPHDSRRHLTQSAAAVTAMSQRACESLVSVKWCRRWDAGRMPPDGPCWATYWYTPCTMTELRLSVHSTLVAVTTFTTNQHFTLNILNWVYTVKESTPCTTTELRLSVHSTLVAATTFTTNQHFTLNILNWVYTVKESTPCTCLLYTSPSPRD